MKGTYTSKGIFSAFLQYYLVEEDCCKFRNAKGRADETKTETYFFHKILRLNVSKM